VGWVGLGLELRLYAVGSHVAWSVRRHASNYRRIPDGMRAVYLHLPFAPYTPDKTPLAWLTEVKLCSECVQTFPSCREAPAASYCDYSYLKRVFFVSESPPDPVAHSVRVFVYLQPYHHSELWPIPRVGRSLAVHVHRCKMMICPLLKVIIALTVLHLLLIGSCHDTKLHPHRVKLYRVGCVIVCGIWLGVGLLAGEGVT